MYESFVSHNIAVDTCMMDLKTKSIIEFENWSFNLCSSVSMFQYFSWFFHSLWWCILSCEAVSPSSSILLHLILYNRGLLVICMDRVHVLPLIYILFLYAVYVLSCIFVTSSTSVCKVFEAALILDEYKSCFQFYPRDTSTPGYDWP